AALSRAAGADAASGHARGAARIHGAHAGSAYNGEVNLPAAASPPSPPRAHRYGPEPRRATRQALIGGVKVGGDAPVVVQSMTNTDPAAVASTARQAADLWRAGAEPVRAAVHNAEPAPAGPRI